MQLKITHDWENDWDPQAYLAQYYQFPKVAQDETAVCKFIRSQLSSFDTLFPTALDIGVGPTLHHEFALVPYVSRLDVADFLPKNLTEIRKYLNGNSDSHDWDTYIKGILTIEGVTYPSTWEIEARKRLLKRRINRVIACNIKNRLPLGTSENYALVTAFYVADSVASSKRDWYAYMSNIANLVAPGGMLLISALRNANYYRVGDVLFPSAGIDEDDVENLYRSLGFDPDSLEIATELVSELSDSGFDSIILAAGRKSLD